MLIANSVPGEKVEYSRESPSHCEDQHHANRVEGKTLIVVIFANVLVRCD